MQDLKGRREGEALILLWPVRAERRWSLHQTGNSPMKNLLQYWRYLRSWRYFSVISASWSPGFGWQSSWSLVLLAQNQCFEHLFLVLIVFLLERSNFIHILLTEFRLTDSQLKIFSTNCVESTFPGKFSVCEHMYVFILLHKIFFTLFTM